VEQLAMLTLAQQTLFSQAKPLVTVRQLPQLSWVSQQVGIAMQELEVAHQDCPAGQTHWPVTQLKLLGQTVLKVKHNPVAGHKAVPGRKVWQLPQPSLVAQQLGMATHRPWAGHHDWPVEHRQSPVVQS